MDPWPHDGSRGDDNRVQTGVAWHMPAKAITYAVERDVPDDEARRLWIAAGFTDGIPVYGWDGLPALLANSTLLVTARDGAKLVGLCRALTDRLVVCHIADLLVDGTYQRRGIGRELVARTRAAAGEHAELILVSNEEATGFYERIGLRGVGNVWTDAD